MARFRRLCEWWIEGPDGGEVEVEVDVWGTPTPGERETRDHPGCAADVEDLTVYVLGRGYDKGDNAEEIPRYRYDEAAAREVAFEAIRDADEAAKEDAADAEIERLRERRRDGG